jgi:hypothetical protein
MEEECKTRPASRHHPQSTLGIAPRAEQRLGQYLLGGHGLVLQPLVHGQRADQREDERDVGFDSLANHEGHPRPADDVIAPLGGTQKAESSVIVRKKSGARTALP